MSADKQSDFAWKAVSGLSAVAAAFVARKVISFAWEKVTGKEPPENPAHPEVSLGEAIGWAVVSGGLIALARMVAQRQAASRWKLATGSLPRELLDRRPE